jgi:hypothetical protein
MKPVEGSDGDCPGGPTWPIRLAWFAVNLSLGLAPSLLFFAWVEQDAALPAVARRLGWPWAGAGAGPVAARMLWDVGLFAVFGLAHSSLAQVGVQSRLRAAIPAEAMRSFYLAVSGTALLILMGFWRPTGVTVWDLGLPEPASGLVAGAIFAVPAVTILWLLVRLGFWEFLGWAQLLGRAADAC